MIIINSFVQHKLEENKNGYTVTLYLNSNLYLTEFADELSHFKDNKTENFTESIKQYIDEKLPNIKVNTVKLMLGSTLIAAFPFGTIQAFASNNTAYHNSQKISIVLNGNVQNYSQDPLVIDNTTYVPIRGVAESIGATVWWNEASKTVGINKGDSRIAFVLGSDIARVNGQVVSMPPSFIKNNTTMVPLRFVSEHLGLDVKWDQSSKSVILTTNDSTQYEYYKVQTGDNLWLISQKFNATVDHIKKLNGLTSNTIYIGQTLKIDSAQGNPTESVGSGKTYSVQPGDNLWLISQKYGTTVDHIKTINNLTSNTIYVGQKIKITSTQTTASQPTNDWPEVTYMVQAGDNVTTVSQKFGVSSQDILKYNYMEPDEWLNSGETIAISGYAPRDYAVTAGEASAPLRVGKLVDWFRDGQYILKRYDVFTITDVNTGKSFKVKMMGGYNHSDIEPLTPTDTEIMRSLYGSWEWTPRAVVIFKDGMNIAASLSGMPHGAEIIEDNGVLGHFDLYLFNSKPHGTSASEAYVQQHKNMVSKAAGK